MKRTNTWADALGSGEAALDLGDGLTMRLPLGRPYTIDQSAGRTVKVWDYLNKREQLIYGDTGWRQIDVANTAGSIRDPAQPGSLALRRVGHVVTARIADVKLTPGNGTGFIFPNVLPSGFRSWERSGTTTRGFLGDVMGAATEHTVNVGSNDIFWSSYTGTNFARASVRPDSAVQRMQGELTWITDDPWPAALPGTPAAA